MSVALKQKKAPVAGKDPKKEEKFYRDGARYVCRSCKGTFFTKSEVEGCFDKHPVIAEVKS